MKAKFLISEDLQVSAIQRLDVPDNPANPDPDLDFPGPYNLDMGIEFQLSPGQEYEVVEVVDGGGDTITLWFANDLCIPNFPKEKVQFT